MDFCKYIHTFDLLLFIANSSIKKITFINKRINNLENNIISNIEFSNNIVGSYLSFWSSPGQWSVKIFGKNKFIFLSPLEKGYIIDKKFNKKKYTLLKRTLNLNQVFIYNQKTLLS